jgi:hypothetical protein
MSGDSTKQTSERVLAEIDLSQLDPNGAALTPATIAWIEVLLTPLAKIVDHCDITLQRVSIQHLKGE